MKRFALLLATVALVTPATAADIIYSDPIAPAPAMDPISYETAAPQWTGAYVGGQIGSAFNTDSGPFSSEGSSFVGANDDSDAGLIGGAHVGYDHQINNIIVGGVADINAIDAESSSSFELENGLGGTDRFGSSSDIDYVGTVRGKVGVAADRIAVYATGGVAYASLDTETSGPGEFTGQPTDGAPAGTYGVVYDQESDEVGYAVGAGVDYLATDNVSVGVEYLYHDLGEASTKVTYAGTGTAAGETTSVSSDTDLDFHTVWAKASFRFN